jgi:hypothetical protein
MAVQPGTGRIFVNDVSEKAGTDANEVNLLARDANFQWPLGSRLVLPLQQRLRHHRR